MGPLKDFKIIEIAGVGPGQLAGMLLADMGASLVRIDRPFDAAVEFAVDPRFNILKHLGLGSDSDPNAIEVHSKKGQIGFIKAFRAEELAPQMDKGYATECTVKKLLPSRDNKDYGVVINIQRLKPAP